MKDCHMSSTKPDTKVAKKNVLALKRKPVATSPASTDSHSSSVTSPNNQQVSHSESTGGGATLPPVRLSGH